MADLSYIVEVSGTKKLDSLATSIDKVTAALDKDNARKLAEFKKALDGMGASLGGSQGLQKGFKDSIGGLGATLEREMKHLRQVISTSAAGFQAEGKKAGQAVATGMEAGLAQAEAKIKAAGAANLKLNAKYATDTETAVRQIQEKGSSAMLQSLQVRASNIQRILQSEAKDAVAIAQKTYGTDFVTAMQDGLRQLPSTLTNSHQALLRLQQAHNERMVREAASAANKIAAAQAKVGPANAQFKANSDAMQQELAKAAQAFSSSPETLRNMSMFYGMQANVQQAAVDRARATANAQFKANSDAMQQELAKAAQAFSSSPETLRNMSMFYGMQANVQQAAVDRARATANAQFKANSDAMQQELAKAAQAFSSSPETLRNMSMFYGMQANVQQAAVDRARATANAQFKANSDAMQQELAKAAQAFSSSPETLRSMSMFYNMQANVQQAAVDRARATANAQFKANSDAMQQELAKAAQAFSSSPETLRSMSMFYGMQANVQQAAVDRARATANAQFKANSDAMQQELAKAAQAFSSSPSTLANMAKFYTMQASAKQAVADRTRQEAREIFQARSAIIKAEAAKFSAESYGPAMASLRSQYTQPAAMREMAAMRSDRDSVRGTSTGIPNAGDVHKVSALSEAFKKLGIDGRNTHSVMRGLASGFDLLWLTWGRLAPLFAGASISFGISKTFKIGSEVEYQIKLMEMMGQTTKEQGSAIRQVLREIDQTTQFTLLQLSEGMVRLGQAGKGPAEAIALLKPAADLASLGLTDLSTTIDLMIQTQSLFDIAVEDSAKTAAQLFKITTASPLTIVNLAGAMKYASEANTRFGQSLEDTLAIMGSLAKAGLRGSVAGTAYINFMRDLFGRSGPAIKALETLRERTGETIALFDKMGKQRSAIDIFNEINEAANKLSTTEADKILGKLFSDRGGRAFYAMIREGNTDLRTMSDILKDTKPEELLKAATGLMDTTRGAVNILGGALVGALDKVFEANETRFKDFIVGLTQATDSKEFLLTVQAMVDTALNFAETIRSLFPILLDLGKAWLVFKAASIGVTVFQALSLTLVGLAPLMATSVGSLLVMAKGLFSLTGAFYVNGTAAIGNAAAQRAAAAGADAAAVAIARNAAVATAATGAMRAYAIVIGFLANPIVGVITTLGILGAAFWSMKEDASEAVGGTTDIIIEKGKLNLVQWDKEIARLRIRNSLMGESDVYSQAESALKANIVQAQGEYKKYETWYNARVAAGHNIDAKHTADLKAKYDAVTSLMKDSAKAQQSIADAREKDDLDALKRQEQRAAKLAARTRTAETIPPASPTVPAGGPGRRAFEESERFFDDKVLPALLKQKDNALAAAKARFDGEKELQDSAYKNLLTTQGQYQADMLVSTITYEQDSIAVIENSAAAYVVAYTKQYAEIEALKKQAKPGSNDYKKLESQQEALRNAAVTETEKMTSEIEKIRLDSNKRQLLAAQNLAGETRKLIKDEEAYWAKAKQETNKVESLQKVAKEYRNISTSIFDNATAEKARAEAVAESKGQHEGQLENMRKEIALRMDAIDALEAYIKAEALASISDPNASARLEQAQAEVARIKESAKRLKERYSKSLEEGLQDGAERGALAYEQEMNAKSAALTDAIAGSLETALTEGGKAGGKALRDYLQAELVRKPLMATIRAVIQPISDMLVGGLSGTANAAVGGGGGVGGMLGTASNLSSLMNLNTAGALGGLLSSSAAYGAAIGTSSFAAGSQAAMLAAQTGTFGAAGLTATSTAAAGAGSGAMASLAAAGPYILAAAALAAAWKPLFGRKLKDSGIQGEFGGENGFQGQSFEYFKGGLFRSDKTKTSELDEEIRKGLGDAFQGMRVQVGTFSTALGLNTDKIAGFTSAIKVSTKGLSAEDAQKKIQEALAGANNELAKQVLGTFTSVSEQITKTIQTSGWSEGFDAQFETINETISNTSYTASVFARDGEQAIDTLKRLSTSLLTVNAVFDTLGTTALTASLASGDLASKLTDAFGGIEAFATATGTYYEAFYSEQERTETGVRQLTTTLAKLGIALPEVGAKDALDQYRALVEAQDINTESGRTAYAALVTLGGGFAQLVTSTDSMGQAARDAATALAATNQGWQDQIDVLMGKETDRSIALRDAGDVSTRALMKVVNGLNDMANASAKAASAAAAAAAANKVAATAAAVLPASLSVGASSGSSGSSAASIDALRANALSGLAGLDVLGTTLSKDFASFLAAKSTGVLETATAAIGPVVASLAALETAAQANAVSFPTAVQKAIAAAASTASKAVSDQLAAPSDAGFLLAESSINALTAAVAAAAPTAEQIAAAFTLANTNQGIIDQTGIINGSLTQRDIELRDAPDESTKTLLRAKYAAEDVAAVPAAAVESVVSAVAAIAPTLDDVKARLLGVNNDIARVGFSGFELALAEIQDRADEAAAAFGSMAPEIVQLAEAERTLLNARNAATATATLDGLATETSRLDLTPLQLQFLGVTDRAAELTRGLLDLGQATTSNVAAVETWATAQTNAILKANAATAASTVGGLQTEIDRFNFTPLQKELAGITDRQAEYIASLTALGQATESNLAVVDKWAQIQIDRVKTRATLESAAAELEASMVEFLKPLGDLAGAMDEITPPAKTLVDVWRTTKTELTALTEGLADALGQLPAATALDGLRATMTALQGITGAMVSIGDQILGIKVGRGDQAAVDLLKGQEAKLFAELATSMDPAGVSSKLASTVLERIKLQGKLETDAINDRYKAEFEAVDSIGSLEAKNRQSQMDALRDQISGVERMGELAKGLRQYVSELKFGDLSSLNPADQLSAAQGNYAAMLAAAQGGDVTAMGNLQGGASGYLQEAQGYYGGATSEYASVFGSVTSALDALGLQPVTDISLLQSQLTALEALEAAQRELQTTTVDTSDREIVALEGINTALIARQDSLQTEAKAQTKAVQDQIVLLQTTVSNQEAQIKQSAAEYAALELKLAAIADSLKQLENNSNLAATA